MKLNCIHLILTGKKKKKHFDRIESSEGETGNYLKQKK